MPTPSTAAGSHRPPRSPSPARTGRAPTTVPGSGGGSRTADRPLPAGPPWTGRTAPPARGSRRRRPRRRARTPGTTRSRIRGRPPSESTEPASTTRPSSTSSPVRLLTLAALRPVRLAELEPAERAVEVQLREQDRAVAAAHVPYGRAFAVHVPAPRSLVPRTGAAPAEHVLPPPGGTDGARAPAPGRTRQEHVLPPSAGRTEHALPPRRTPMKHSGPIRQNIRSRPTAGSTEHELSLDGNPI